MGEVSTYFDHCWEFKENNWELFSDRLILEDVTCGRNGQEDQHLCAFPTSGQILIFLKERVIGEIPSTNLAVEWDKFPPLYPLHHPDILFHGHLSSCLLTTNGPLGDARLTTWGWGSRKEEDFQQRSHQLEMIFATAGKKMNCSPIFKKESTSGLQDFPPLSLSLNTFIHEFYANISVWTCLCKTDQFYFISQKRALLLNEIGFNFHKNKKNLLSSKGLIKCIVVETQCYSLWRKIPIRTALLCHLPSLDVLHIYKLSETESHKSKILDST